MNDLTKSNTSSSHSVLLKALTLCLLAIPIISLLLNIGAWLKYGMDIPLFDDWRQYDANNMGRLDLSYLFTPVNDTIYAVGLFLDSLIFRIFNGNTIVYQLISLTVILGSILILQWKLIKCCTKNNLAAASSFALTVLIVQPDTYWGWSNLAYHQALPIVFSLAILLLTFSDKLPLKRALPTVFIASFLSGFSYISGAFANLTILATFVILQLIITTPTKIRMRWIALAMVPGTLITTAAQAWVIVGIQHGTHRADAPMAFPWQADFWLYLLGKIARSLMLPASHPVFSIAVTVVAISASLLILSYTLRKSALNHTSDEENKCISIFTTVLAIVFVYLLLIAAGRTNLRPENLNAPLEIFETGFQRFHFIWVTLVWPWLLLLLSSSVPKKHQKKANSILATITGGLILAAIVYTPLISHAAFYKTTLEYRKTGLACIIPKIQVTGPVDCETINTFDLQLGLQHGIAAGASFSRLLPYLPIALGTNTPKPLLRLTEERDGIQLINMQQALNAEDRNRYTSSHDPMMILPLPSDRGIDQCEHVALTASITSDEDSLAQVFFLPKGTRAYSQENSQTLIVKKQSTPQILQFEFSNNNGFENTVRFDPVTESQNFALNELEIRCRSSINH